MTKIFFDTEFTGLHQNTTLISIGLISECGKTFYAEFADYDRNQVNRWVQDNAIDKTKFINKVANRYCTFSDLSVNQKKVKDIECYGNTKWITRHLKTWLSQFKDIEIWSDCLAYDWVLFNNLFGTAFDIPKNVYYIPFDICTLFKIKGIEPDINREKYVNLQDGTQKHNALWDAKVIKKCYEKLIELEYICKKDKKTEDYQKRVVEEKKELDIKIEKLGTFIKSDIAVPKDLLKKQIVLMKKYSDILNQRIKLF